MTPARPPSPRRARRLLVIAAAGYGKTTFAEAALTPEGRTSGAFVLEDVHRLSASERLAALEAVAALGDDRTVTVTSREPLDEASRSLLRGQVFERGPQDLALTPHAIARVLTEQYGVSDPEMPTRVHSLTGGWPALVHFAGDALAQRPADDLMGAITRPGTSAAAWLEREVFTQLRPETVTVLAALAELEPITRDAAERVFAGGGTTSGERLELTDGSFELLARIGLLMPHPRLDLIGREGLLVVPAVASTISRRRACALTTEHWRRAAEWYEQHAFPFAAAKAWHRAGEPTRAAALLVSDGSVMIEQGDAAEVVSLIEEVGLRPLHASLRRTYAEALHMSGASSEALRAYTPLIELADQDGWEPGLAHRVAAVHHTQGALRAAAEVLDKVPADLAVGENDTIRWLACQVNVWSILGDDDRAREQAGRALALAERSGDPRSLVAAHQAMAKTSSGSRKERHLSLALEAAREVGDLLSMARILVNQSFLLLASARYLEAARVAREAVRATEVARPTGALVAALHNLGEALTAVGDYDEARWQLERSVSISRRLGPSRTAAGLCGLGDIHRAQGRHELGKAAYEEAASLARASDELQVLVPALAGLARLLAGAAPEEARAAGEEAGRLAPSSLAAVSLTAQGWVALTDGDRVRAAELAAESVAAARSCQAHDLLADALELAAESTDAVGDSRPALAEALAIWRSGGAEPAASRIEVLLGRLDGADSSARSLARKAAQRLQRLGVAAVNGRPFGSDVSAKAVSVHVLGGFEVVVNGEPVALTAWRSRQARTLVKILAGRRGRPSTRAFLCELLWPDDDPHKTGHRLSVLLTTVRGVLDPARAWPTDHYVASDSTGVWLDLSHVTLDAESLLADAAHASALLAEGETEHAREILGDIDGRYGGDAFEDEPYESWAEGLREETRAAWLRSLRHLASLATREGRTSDVCTILVRLLNADPYDERVHRGLVKALVRSGRHGEARRAFDNWCEAMAAVDAPAPDASVLTPPQPDGSTAEPPVLTPR